MNEAIIKTTIATPEDARVWDKRLKFSILGIMILYILQSFLPEGKGNMLELICFTAFFGLIGYSLIRAVRNKTTEIVFEFQEDKLLIIIPKIIRAGEGRLKDILAQKHCEIMEIPYQSIKSYTTNRKAELIILEGSMKWSICQQSDKRENVLYTEKTYLNQIYQIQPLDHNAGEIIRHLQSYTKKPPTIMRRLEENQYNKKRNRKYGIKRKK